MNTNSKKASDCEIISAYNNLNNVWKVAELFNMCGQSVHSRLTRLGVINKMNVFSEKDKKILIDKYVEHRDKGEIETLAKELGRTKQFICRQANKLGLTNICHDKDYFRNKTNDQYSHYHQSVRRKRGKPNQCDVCGSKNDVSKTYEWANLTGKYQDINDYQRMCRSCHRNHDKKEYSDRGKTTEFQKKEIIDMVLSGKPYKEIGDCFGVTIKAISHYAISKGIRRRKISMEPNDLKITISQI